MKRFFAIIFLVLFCTSCVAVREYEKVYLNDEDMQLAGKGVERFETNFQIYREASAGANGGKTGGGCGCN
ncbi:MAG: arginine decarboxylase [Flavobacteriaceae bacterium]|nr:MAG: arginine decarboxylase [Flavobacteriaceae bacterium]